MRRIDDNTVEFTPTESKAYDYFHNLLDGGYDCEKAARLVKAYYPVVTAEFLEHLKN